MTTVEKVKQIADKHHENLAKEKEYDDAMGEIGGDSNANNVILASQIASKSAVSTFDLFQT